MQFDIPEGYADLTADQKAEITNGCGAQGDWKTAFVPNDLLKLDISEACRMHDYDYWRGRTQEDKDAADVRLLINLIVIINNHAETHADSNGHIPVAHRATADARRQMAMVFYSEVHNHGHTAFWRGKA